MSSFISFFLILEDFLMTDQTPTGFGIHKKLRWVGILRSSLVYQHELLFLQPTTTPHQFPSRRFTNTISWWIFCRPSLDDWYISRRTRWIGYHSSSQSNCVGSSVINVFTYLLIMKQVKPKVNPQFFTCQHATFSFTIVQYCMSCQFKCVFLVPFFVLN